MAGDIDVWLIDLASMPSLDDCDLTTLSATERAHFHTFLHPEPARRFALCRLVLRHLLAAPSTAPGAALEIASGAAGKPYCVTPGLPHFNLSHASQVAAIAISHTLEVGVDIEPAASFVETARMQARICSAAERQWLAAHPARADADFGRLWTRKEALLKACGAGLTVSPSELDLSGQIDAEEGVVARPCAHQRGLETLRWQALPPWKLHVGAVAARVEPGSGPLRVRVREFESSRLRD